MKKTKISRFVKDLLIANFLVILIYLLFIIILNFCTGGGISQMSGAFEYRGYSADDMNPALIAFINVMLIINNILPFFTFYLFMFIRLKRNEKEKEEFLSYIGTKKFERTEFDKNHFAIKGKPILIMFIISMAIFSIIDIINIPFLTIISLPQTVFAQTLLSSLGMNGVLLRLTVSLISLPINTSLFFIFQKKICPAVYEAWAKERMRVDT